MFTGIVSDIGLLHDITQLDHGKRLTIKTNYSCSDIAIGASIACDGVCLTVVDKEDDWFAVEAWQEALDLTTIDHWQVGKKINLERSLCLGDELGGHLVFGHVDTVAKIISITPEGSALRFLIDLPRSIEAFIAPKGSVCLNGTSLTINCVNEYSFDVLLIDHTLKVTNWSYIGEGSYVNVEIDQLARYSVRYAQLRDRGDQVSE